MSELGAHTGFRITSAPAVSLMDAKQGGQVPVLPMGTDETPIAQGFADLLPLLHEKWHLQLLR